MKGKTVLITGANQGIGKASAIALGKLGARLVIVCRNGQKGRAAVADIQQAGVSDVELIVGDMSSRADIRRVAGEFRAKNERLDVLLNNAGVLVTTKPWRKRPRSRPMALPYRRFWSERFDAER